MSLSGFSTPTQTGQCFHAEVFELISFPHSRGTRSFMMHTSLAAILPHLKPNQIWNLKKKKKLLQKKSIGAVVKLLELCFSKWKWKCCFLWLLSTKGLCSRDTSMWNTGSSFCYKPNVHFNCNFSIVVTLSLLITRPIKSFLWDWRTSNVVNSYMPVLGCDNVQTEM